MRITEPRTYASPVCILGMHRSGTSYLAGSLEQSGLDLGTVSEWNEHNRRGNRENAAVVSLNDSVLQSNGGSWDEPPSHVSWSVGQLQEARQILDRNLGTKGWGFKDPRTLLTLAGWLEVAGDLRFVGVFRHPLAVASSLQTRAKYGGLRMATTACLELWLTYNQRLLACYDEESFPVVCFDWPEDRLEQELDRVAEGLGLHQSRATDRFLSPDLRSRPAERAGRLPDPVSRTYQQLLQIADLQADS